MKVITIVATVFLTMVTAANGQVFEGKVVYQNIYKSKLPGVTDEQLASSMGSRQDYLIKGGNYKSISNGSSWTWQIYIHRDNKLFNKMADSDVILWIDGGGRSDQILSTTLKKEVAEILGHKCDEVVLTLKNGVEKYYFNSNLGIDPAVYSKHLYGNWYDYLKLAKAVPLKMVVETPQFVMTSTAIEVKAMNLAPTEFELPKGAKIAKMPS